MTYPPQQPEDGWSDQQAQQPIDPFATGGAGQGAAPAYPQQGYGQQQPDQGQAQYQYPNQDPGYEQPTDQTQALRQQQEFEEAGTQVLGVVGQQPQQPVYDQQEQYPQQEQYGQPQYQQPEYGQQEYQQPQDYGQPEYQQPQPQYDQTQYLPQQAPPQPSQQPEVPQQQYPVQQYEQPPAQPAYPAAPVSAEPAPTYYQSAAPVSADPASAQPYSAQPASGQPYSAQPYSSAPASAQPASGQPFSAQPASAQPASGQPYSAQPYSSAPASAQPYSAGPASAPPGVPESPFVATPQPAPSMPTPVSASPTSSQPWGGGVVPQFTPKAKRKGLPGWVYVVGAVVVVVALGVGAVFYFGIGGEKAETTQGTKADGKEEEAEKPVPITEDTSGLTYLSLPKPWSSLTEMDGFESLPGFASVNGQGYVTEKGGKPTDGWMGLFSLGEMDTKAIGYEDADSLTDSVKTFADVIDEGNWKDPADESRKKDLDGLERDEELAMDYLRIDGRRGVLATYHVSWDSTSIKEKGSTVMIGLLDLGDGRAAGYFVDLPDSLSKKQSEAVQQALLTMQFE